MTVGEGSQGFLAEIQLMHYVNVAVCTAYGLYAYSLSAAYSPPYNQSLQRNLWMAEAFLRCRKGAPCDIGS